MLKLLFLYKVINVSICFNLSLICNGVLAILLLDGWLKGEPSSDGRLSVLKREVDVGIFNQSDVLFTLPKGLVVRNASATGPGWFEPNRFTIVVTSDDVELLDFDGLPTGATEFYSADRNLAPK